MFARIAKRIAVTLLVFGVPTSHVLSAEGNRENDLRDIVLHAGGVVEFRRPPAWQLSEVPMGREIRLVFTRDQDHPDQNTADELWFTFHVKRSGPRESPEQLGMWLARRMRQFDGGHSAFGELQRLVVDDHPGFVQPYTTAAPSNMRNRSGQRIAVATAWGILELHWQADSSERETFQQVAAELLESVRFNEPLRRPIAAAAESVADARQILGSWKAYRSRMRLRRDGSIIIIPDAKRIQLGSDTAAQPIPIIGKFESREDLLMVRWNDGSRLNFRWALRDDTLLLTDHNGQTTKLNPLLD